MFKHTFLIPLRFKGIGMVLQLTYFDPLNIYLGNQKQQQHNMGKADHLMFISVRIIEDEEVGE